MKAVCKILTLAITMAMLATAPAIAKEAKSCCAKKTCSKCCAKKCKKTEWQSPENVHWANRLVAYGNYLKVDKAEIPAPAPAPEPRVAPKFNPVFFDLDKSELKPEATATLSEVVAYLKQYGADKVQIEGNCCDLASNEYNVKLGQRRADAVKGYLVENGINADRICATTNGEEKPAYGTDHREMNRRADVIVIVVQ
ncbi:MAG: OmpA family protein [Candidatus Hydrogenedentes bacterium]|nr:OmpA family protein [Candidatus Hydrogenedentota bacterium]